MPNIKKIKKLYVYYCISLDVFSYTIANNSKSDVPPLYIYTNNSCIYIINFYSSFLYWYNIYIYIYKHV